MRICAAAVFMAGLIGVGTPSDALAGSTTIEMLNERGGERFVYSSDIVRIQAGDSVTFVPTTKGHNAQSVPGMLPDGADKIRVGFNKSETITFSIPGVYGIRCTPHVGAGMVTTIVVGEPVNLDEAIEGAGKVSPRARQRFQSALKSLR